MAEIMDAGGQHKCAYSECECQSPLSKRTAVITAPTLMTNRKSKFSVTVSTLRAR
jgi:hypothetical protein